LLSHELINWSGSEEALWNAAEAAERRGNARVVRELRPALPAELPLDKQIALVRGYCLWLRDQYGVAVQADIHAPRFLDESVQRQHERGKLSMGSESYLDTLFDPERTNLNFHAHLLLTTRHVCQTTGKIGAKTTQLTDPKSGPKEMLRIRQEWEKRTNSALKSIGSDARIDLRSYEAMACAGDAPEGLMAQDHMGPLNSARSRKRLEKIKQDDTPAGKRRRDQRSHNDALWDNWVLKRASQRATGRKEAARIARVLETARKQKAGAEKRRLQCVTDAKGADAALEAATQFDSLKTGSVLRAALLAACGELDEPPCSEPDEYSSEVDLETYEPPAEAPQPEPVLEVRIVRRPGQRQL
jgi:hypothetical protein